jgi:hypothetical protein
MTELMSVAPTPVLVLQVPPHQALVVFESSTGCCLGLERAEAGSPLVATSLHDLVSRLLLLGIGLLLSVLLVLSALSRPAGRLGQWIHMSWGSGYTWHGAVDTHGMGQWIHMSWGSGYTFYGAVDTHGMGQWIHMAWGSGYT